MTISIFYSAVECSYFWLPLAGFIIGLAASMTGSGGGFFFLPVLVLFFHVPPQVAVATSLAASLPIGLIGSLGHYREGHVDGKLWAVFSITGIVGALIGAGITNLTSPGLLKTGFGIYAILMAIPILINYWSRKKARTVGLKQHKYLKNHKIFRGSFYGFIAGMVAGTFGTSGAAPVLAGLLTLRIPVKRVVGTSLLIVLINTIFALGAHLVMGETDLTLVLFLAAGSGLGAYVGTKLLAGMKTGRVEAPVRLWYAIGMIVLGMVIIFSEQQS
ncbi:MAG: sulfite exporter TauE/SafE family protein [Mariniphaga sp.]|nr:sulfite exporter TauE/SafE family protein [Mariniphaga sp.]MDD4425003.1 sulfite exporter TauE/SafE family protein [Mariniphaga sp.]